MKVPEGKIIYHKGKKFRPGDELPSDYQTKEKNEPAKTSGNRPPDDTRKQG